jgi:hypothetical protein
MDSIGVQVGLLLAVLLLLERLATARGWGGLSAAGVPVLTWLVFTAMALWCEAALAFVAVHALLFALGTDVAGIGLILTGVVLVATPFATAYLVRRATRRAPVAR